MKVAGIELQWGVFRITFKVCKFINSIRIYIIGKTLPNFFIELGMLRRQDRNYKASSSNRIFECQVKKRGPTT